MNTASRLRELAITRGLLLGAVVLLMYLVLAPSHIVAADNAEFSTLAAIGGRAHPSGYPLYVLYLRATSWLPTNPAHAASLATACLGAATVVMLHAACRAWGAHPTAASIAATIFAAAPLVLRVHTEADVFALNSLLGATLICLAAPASPLRGMRRAAALGLVAGLALSNNLTAALLAPVGIYGVVLAARESRAVSAVSTAIGMALVGLLPYAYLFVAPDDASWAPVHGVGDLLDTFLRKDYGYASHVPGSNMTPVSSVIAHATVVGRVWLWIPAIGGLAMLCIRSIRGEHPWAWRMLAASWLLCGPIFASRLGVDTTGVGGYIGARMQILSCVVLAVPIATAMSWVGARVSRQLSSTTAAIACAVAFVALIAAAWPKLERVHGSAVEDGIENMFLAVPHDGVVIVVSEDLCFGARYLQLAKRERSDVTVICSALLTRDWYRERLPLSFSGSSSAFAPADDARIVLATGRPLLVEPGLRTILDVFPSYPTGILRRVLPAGSPPPDVGTVFKQQRTLFSTFAIHGTNPDADDDFAAVAYLRYAGAWSHLARDLDRTGDRDRASAAMQLANALRPQ